MNYVGYTVPPRNAYGRGGRGGRGGGRGGARGARPRPAVGNRRNRADNKDKTHAVNGKAAKTDEAVAAQIEEGAAQDENATLENDTNGKLRIKQRTSVR